MQIIRDPADASTLADPELRQLIEKTIHDLSEDYPYDPDELGYFLIVEPGDTLETIDAQLGFSILSNRYSGIRFTDRKFNRMRPSMARVFGFETRRPRQTKAD